VVLVADLNDIEDAPWSEWQGVHDGRQPCRLSQNTLASLLKPFLIRPRKFWPLRRGPTTKSLRGYFRSQFEAAYLFVRVFELIDALANVGAALPRKRSTYPLISAPERI
jgi:hypothetical protein